MGFAVTTRAIGWWLLVSVFVVACGGHGPLPAAPSSPPGPAGAALRFVGAHAAGDAAGADAVASPLLRAELARRGQDGDWPFVPLWRANAAILDFAHAATVVDSDGFAHVVLTARPKRDPAAGPVTLWRIDLDPAERVIWGEPVRLLAGRATRSVRADRALVGRDGAWWPHHARVLAAVRSDAGDGYDLLGIGGNGSRPIRVLFVGRDTSSGAVPDYWSYGRPIPLYDSEGQRRLAPPFPSESGPDGPDATLLRRYLVRLW